MESMKNFLDNLENERERQRQDIVEREEEKKAELQKIFQTLNQLRAEERKQCTLIFDKNLGAITKQKHRLRKAVQETVDEVGLPISSASRINALNFFNDTVTFINNQCGDNREFRDEDVCKISATLQASNENTNKEIVKVKNQLAAVETVIESIPELTELNSSVDHEEESELDATVQFN